jgi:hypothetical protein
MSTEDGPLQCTTATATRTLIVSASSEGGIFEGERDEPIQCTTVGVPIEGTTVEVLNGSMLETSIVRLAVKEETMLS